jgi:hypothetical protein
MSPMLSSAYTHLAVAGSASPSVNRTAIPPCTVAAGFSRSLGHAMSTIEFAWGWRSPRSSWPSRRPHRRRAVAAGIFLPLPMTDPWGHGSTCLSQCAHTCVQLWVALAFPAGFQRKGFKEKNFLFLRNCFGKCLCIHFGSENCEINFGRLLRTRYMI